MSAVLILSSCALPREEAWRIIRNDGFFSYLAIELGAKDPPPGTMLARRSSSPPSRYWQPPAYGGSSASVAPLISVPPSPVLITRAPDGSPRTTARIESRPKPMNSAPKVLPPVARAEPPVVRTLPEPAVKSAAEAVGARPAPAPVETKPKVVAEAPKPPVETPKPKAPEPTVSQAAPKPAATKPTAEETPYGVPVPGRPGLVNSPYAGKLQLVDVTGLKPGQEVKCPYSGKLFRVPPGATAEARPSGNEPAKK